MPATIIDSVLWTTSSIAFDWPCRTLVYDRQHQIANSAGATIIPSKNMYRAMRPVAGNRKKVYILINQSSLEIRMNNINIAAANKYRCSKIGNYPQGRRFKEFGQWREYHDQRKDGKKQLPESVTAT